MPSSEQPLRAYSVEKLHHAKICAETWNIVLVKGRLEKVVYGRALSKKNILPIRPAQAMQ
jgi:hypothetical protein